MALGKEMLPLDPLSYHLLSNEMINAVSSDALLAFPGSAGYKPEIIDFAALA